MEFLDEVLLIVIDPESQEVEWPHSILHKGKNTRENQHSKFENLTYIVRDIKNFVDQLSGLSAFILLTRVFGAVTKNGPYLIKYAQNKFQIAMLEGKVDWGLTQLSLLRRCALDKKGLDRLAETLN